MSCHKPTASTWVVVLAAVLAACSGGDGPGTGGGEESPPGLLQGPAGSLAIDALPAIAPIPANVGDEEGEFLLTRVEATLADDATVAQFNAAVAAIGATGLADAVPGSPFLTLIVPRQADSAALVALAEQLRSQPGIQFAVAARQPVPAWLPGEEAGTPQAPEMLAHLLPTRFPAAWNVAFTEDGARVGQARDCAAEPAVVIIVDYFETPPEDPTGELAPLQGAQRFGRFGSGPEPHGWQVAATVASAFNGAAPTGAMPLTDCIRFVLVDHSGVGKFALARLLARAIAAQPPGSRMVVNTSFGMGKFYCGPQGNRDCGNLSNLDATPAKFLQVWMAERVEKAIDWAETLGPDLDDRLLLVKSAGNDANQPLGRTYSGMAAAGLAYPTPLPTQLGNLELFFSPSSDAARTLWTDQTNASNPHPSLLLDATEFQRLQSLVARRLTRIPDGRNLLIVGAGRRTIVPQDILETDFSNHGSDFLAVGEGVVSLGGQLINGTSLAAPQVAGLAAYLWAMSDLDTLPTPETRNLIAASVYADAFTLRKSVDALAATLALDRKFPDGQPSLRGALLDVNGDDRFDELDLQRFMIAYGPDSAGAPTEPATRDYGRFDLNGDGFTGGAGTGRFDLDDTVMTPDGGPMYGTVNRAIEGYPLGFDEAAVTDLQVLCFHAYSARFGDGNPTEAQRQARTDILGPGRCIGARMAVVFAGQVTGTTSLDVTVEIPDGNGQFVPAPNVLVTFTVNCGSVTSASGITDASGQVGTAVTPAAGCTTVTVDIVARADTLTAPLARRTVTATVGNSGTALESVLVMTGRTPGTIEGFIVELGSSLGPDPTLTGPISDPGGFVARLMAAIGTVPEIGRITVSLGEPVDLALDFGVPTTEAGVGATGAGCASNVSIRVGDVRRNESVSFGTGRLGVAGCLAAGHVTAGDVEADIDVVGSGGNVTVTAGNVRRSINVGSPLSLSQAFTATLDVNSAGRLSIRNTVGATVRIQGLVQRNPAELSGTLFVIGNSNLTLAPIQGGVVNQLSIESTSFTAPPAIALGDILHPGGDVVSPKGDVRIINNTGLALGGLVIGSNIDGDLVITDNEGFSDDEARSFAQSKNVGGGVSISGNTP